MSPSSQDHLDQAAEWIVERLAPYERSLDLERIEAHDRYASDGWPAITFDYVSRRHKGVVFVVGCWARDYVIEFEITHRNSLKKLVLGSFSDYHIGELLYGAGYRSVRAHPYDEHGCMVRFDQIERLLVDCDVELAADRGGFFRRLKRLRASGERLAVKQEGEAFLRRCAEEAWDSEEYEEYLRLIGELSGSLNARDEKRIRIAERSLS